MSAASVTLCVLTIVRSSFRRVSSAVLPRAWGRKPCVAAALALGLVAGCGGGGEIETRRVQGDDFRFLAPSDWHVSRTLRSVTARPERGSPELVSVTTFRLTKPFRPALWEQVVRELDVTAARLAREIDGEVEQAETIRVARRRARQYDLVGKTRGDDPEKLEERLVFLFRGRREYQLLCFRTGEVREACELLVSSFRLTG